MILMCALSKKKKDLNDAHCPSASGNPREVTFADAATQLSFAEFFERCILSKALPPRHILLRQAKHIGTSNSLSSSSSLTSHHLRHHYLRIKHAWVLHTTSLLNLRPRVHIRIMALFLLRQARPPPTSSAISQTQVSTTHVGTHTTRSSATNKTSAGTAVAGTHSAIGADTRAGRGPFPKPRPVVLPKEGF